VASGVTAILVVEDLAAAGPVVDSAAQDLAIILAPELAVEKDGTATNSIFAGWKTFFWQ